MAEPGQGVASSLGDIVAEGVLCGVSYHHQGMHGLRLPASFCWVAVLGVCTAVGGSAGKETTGASYEVSVTRPRPTNRSFEEIFAGYPGKQNGHQDRSDNAKERYAGLSGDKEQTPPNTEIAEVVRVSGVLP